MRCNIRVVSAREHFSLSGKASGNKCYGYRVVRAFDAAGKVTTGELENEVAAIEAAMAEATRDVPDIHPNVAELYRRKVERLTEALANPDNRTEAATASRALIEKVGVTPTGRRGEHDVLLFRDLEKILAWAEDRGAIQQTPLRLSFRHEGEGVAVKGIEGSPKRQPPRSAFRLIAAALVFNPDLAPRGHPLPQGRGAYFPALVLAM